MKVLPSTSGDLPWIKRGQSSTWFYTQEGFWRTGQHEGLRALVSDCGRGQRVVQICQQAPATTPRSPAHRSDGKLLTSDGPSSGLCQENGEGLWSTSQLALIGPLAGLPAASVRLAVHIELRWGREWADQCWLRPLKNRNPHHLCIFFFFKKKDFVFLMERLHCLKLQTWPFPPSLRTLTIHRFLANSVNFCL